MNQKPFEARVLDGFKEIDTFFSSYIDNFTAEHNLSSVQVKTLMEVYLRKNISMKDLCNRLGMSKSNLSPVCKKLEGSGLLKKTRDYHDQRIVNLALTEDGQDIIENMHKGMKEHSDPFFKRISDNEREVILKGFEYMIKALNR